MANPRSIAGNLRASDATLLAGILSLILTFWLCRILQTGQISVRAARGAIFDVTVESNPEEYWGAVAFFSMLTLACLAGALVNARAWRGSKAREIDLEAPSKD